MYCISDCGNKELEAYKTMDMCIVCSTRTQKEKLRAQSSPPDPTFSWKRECAQPNPFFFFLSTALGLLPDLLVNVFCFLFHSCFLAICESPVQCSLTVFLSSSRIDSASLTSLFLSSCGVVGCTIPCGIKHQLVHTLLPFHCALMQDCMVQANSAHYERCQCPCRRLTAAVALTSLPSCHCCCQSTGLLIL